jgi:hypothetical protein
VNNAASGAARAHEADDADDAVSLYPVPDQFARSLTVQIEDTHAPVVDAASDQAWARLCAQNPKLFNGPILAVTRLALDKGTIWCARDSYRRLALRSEWAIDITILSVTAVLEAPDKAGKPHLLLGQRGTLTRSYPGLWELGPAGGLDVPQAGTRTQGHADVMAQVNAELREETGIREHVQEGRVVAVVLDRLAGSCDIVLRSRFETSIEKLDRSDADEPWEYAQTRWLALDEIGDFLRENHEQTIGPTRVLLNWLRDAND